MSKVVDIKTIYRMGMTYDEAHMYGISFYVRNIFKRIKP
jgi:hypothetical protein